MLTEQSKRHSITGLSVVVVLMALLALGVLSGCDEDDIERHLGRSTAASVESTYGVNHDPLVCEWIDYVGQSMVSFSTRQHIPYTFKVLNANIVNAFAGPWGHIYVTEGMLEFAETEDEVWCVVGHEIGHVEHRDIIKSLKQSILFSIGVGLIGKKSETFGEVAGIGLGLLSLRYSRKDEYAADDEGRRLSYAAGYDPHGEIQFFKRLQKEKERGSPSYIEVLLSTHPPTERRIGRQQQMPELDSQNATALLHIGRGYMRRAQYARAIDYFEGVMALSPDSVQAHTALADALAGRGEHQRAAEHYQAALNQQQADRYVAQRLAQAQNPPPITVAALPPAESTGAQQQMERAKLVALHTSTAAARAEQFCEQFDGKVATASSRNRQTNNELLNLAGDETALDDSSRDAVLEANAAIGKAADSVYAAEQVRNVVEQLAPQLAQAGAEARSRLEKLAAGEGYAGQLAIVERSLRELEAATSELAEAQEQAIAAAEAIRQAQNLATESLSVIHRIMDYSGDDADRKAFLTRDARQSAARTEDQAREALAAINRAKKPATRARLRTLVARLNLIGMKAPATQMPGLDELVAHYTLGKSAQVSSVRDEGMGYGDTALILAASKSSDVAPGQLAEGVTPGRSIVNHISTFTDSAYGANILLRFLANAMEQEVATEA